MTKIDQIIHQIKELRDADSHVCPAHSYDAEECTCSKYDLVIEDIYNLVIYDKAKRTPLEEGTTKYVCKYSTT